MTVIDEIAAERRRQTEEEHWDAQHDDLHSVGELALFAALYAAPEPIYRQNVWEKGVSFHEAFPPGWDRHWDKRHKHDRRRQLVIAGALIVAEIERLDRQSAKEQKSQEDGRRFQLPTRATKP